MEAGRPLCSAPPSWRCSYWNRTVDVHYLTNQGLATPFTASLFCPTQVNAYEMLLVPGLTAPGQFGWLTVVRQNKGSGCGGEAELSISRADVTDRSTAWSQAARARAEPRIKFKPKPRCNRAQYANRKGFSVTVTDWRSVRFIFIFLLQFNS